MKKTKFITQPISTSEVDFYNDLYEDAKWRKKSEDLQRRRWSKISARENY